MSYIIHDLSTGNGLGNKTTEQPRGIQWNLTQKLEDLSFADGINLLPHTHRDMQAKTHELQTYT